MILLRPVRTTLKAHPATIRTNRPDRRTGVVNALAQYKTGPPGVVTSIGTMGAELGVEGADDVGAPPPDVLTGCDPGEPGCAGRGATGVRTSVVDGPLGTE
jgi:hypothetical protein